jgi:hypothetical protein
MFIYWFFLLIIIRSVMKLVGAYVFLRSAKRKRDQWEGSSEAIAAELQKVKGQLQDGAMDGESTPTDVKLMISSYHYNYKWVVMTILKIVIMIIL